MKTTNMLSTLYDRFISMQQNFRTIVENECKWSTPTFYRRVRTPLLNSPVEEKMMLKVAEIQAKELLKLIEEQTQILEKEMNPYPSHLQDKL